TGVIRRGGGDLPENLQAVAKIIALEGGIGVAAQGRGGLRNRPCLALNLGLKLDRGVSEIVALEGLVRRLRCDQAKHERCANRYGANQTDHDGTPWAADERRALIKQVRNGDGLMAAKQQ